MSERRGIREPDEGMPKTRAIAKQSGVKVYFTGKPCLNGHIAVRITSSGKCTQCDSEKKKKAYAENPDKARKRALKWAAENQDKAKAKNKKWASENREHVREYNREYQREWREKNPDKVLEIKKKYESVNADKISESRKEWRKENLDLARRISRDSARRKYAEDPEKARARNRKRRAADPEKNREYQRNSDKKRLSKPQGRLTASVKAGVIRGLKKGAKSGRKTFEILGYTPEDLRNHLDKLFLPGMSWENYGEWHIDHVIPLSAFNYETPDDIDFRRAWALSNLQPLWAFDNISKHAKITEPFQPSLLLSIKGKVPQEGDRVEECKR